MLKTVEEIQQGLRSHRAEIVAAETGLHYNTVRKYAGGRVLRPSLETVQRLSGWLEKQEAVAGATA